MHSESESDFQSLVDAYYGPLYRFALSLTHSTTDASDFVQDTFAIWATKGQQMRDRSKVKSWLFTTLHRRFLETHRRLVRFPHVEINSAEAELPIVDVKVVNRLDSETLIKILQGLEPGFRAPVALFYLEDYSYNEIADILEIPLGTVKSRISRGLAEMKLLLLKTTPLPAQKESRLL